MSAESAIRAACVVALAAGAAVMAGAQGGAQPAAPAPRTGVVEQVTVHGKALEGNLEGDSPDRHVTVYLPPSYATDKDRRFAVLYLLHGYGGRDDMFTRLLANLAESADALAAAPGFSELIVVTPDPYTLHKGSMYSNSPTTGDWERFIADDLVAYIDGHYRTLANRTSRGLAGHSMGGYGALRIGMKRPDVFMSLYLMSSCCLSANRDPRPERWRRLRRSRRARRPRKPRARPGFGPSVLPRVGRGLVAEPHEPAALPRPAGEGRQGAPRHRGEVGGQRAKRDGGGSTRPNLKRYYAVAIEIGTKDGLLAVEPAAAREADAAARGARLRGVRRRSHQQGPRADRVARAAVLRQEPRGAVSTRRLPYHRRNEWLSKVDGP